MCDHSRQREKVVIEFFHCGATNFHCGQSRSVVSSIVSFAVAARRGVLKQKKKKEIKKLKNFRLA